MRVSLSVILNQILVVECSLSIQSLQLQKIVILYPFIFSMNTLNQQRFKETLQYFYQKTIKSHPNKLQLKNKLKHFFQYIHKQPNHTDIEYTSLQPKTNTLKKDKDNDYQNHSMIKSSSKEHHTLTISRSRSKIGKSRDSSNNLIDNDSKLFNCQWIYNSTQASRTILYAIMATFILNDNKLAFKFFEDKINDALSQDNNFSDLALSTIARQWQRIGDLLARSKSLRWQKNLNEVIDKLPLQFTKLAVSVILALPEQSTDDLSNEVLTKLSKQIKITVTYFRIFYRDIEQVKKIGKFGQQVCIGWLKNGNHYVVSTKTPEYCKQEMNLRELRQNFRDTLKVVLRQYVKNTQMINFKSSGSIYNDKQAISKEYFEQQLLKLHSQ